MEETPQKSLDRWRFEIKTIGKKHWLLFYETFMGVSASSPTKLYRAVNLYGDWPVFEAIVESSNRELGADPLMYVLKVAHGKWKTSQQEEDANAEYVDSIERAKEITLQHNAQLAKKLAPKPAPKRRGRPPKGTK